MSVFYGTYDSSLDTKRRVSIPAPFRNRIDTDPESGRDKQVALFFSPEPDYPTIFGCTFSMLDALTHVQARLEDKPKGIRRVASKIFRTIVEHKIDNTGRIVLDKKLIYAANIEKKVFFHGQGHFFEIWPIEDTDDYFEAEEQSLSRLILMKMTEEAGDRAAKGLAPLLNGGQT